MLIPLKVGELTINLWGIISLVVFAVIMFYVKRSPKVGNYYSLAISSWVSNIIIFFGLAFDFNNAKEVSAFESGVGREP